MYKTNMLILILVMLSIAVPTGYAQEANNGENDTIVINESVNVVNITENSNETEILETSIKEEQKNSSPGFSLVDSMISLIIAILLIMSIIYIRKNTNKGENNK